MSKITFSIAEFKLIKLLVFKNIPLNLPLKKYFGTKEVHISISRINDKLKTKCHYRNLERLNMYY